MIATTIEYATVIHVRITCKHDTMDRNRDGYAINIMLSLCGEQSSQPHTCQAAADHRVQFLAGIELIALNELIPSSPPCELAVMCPHRTRSSCDDSALISFLFGENPIIRTTCHGLDSMLLSTLLFEFLHSPEICGNLWMHQCDGLSESSL